MKCSHLFAMTAVIGIGACTSPKDLRVDRGERTAYAELNKASDASSVPQNMSVSPERESYRWQAEDWQPGQVRSVSPEFVELDPYLAGVGKKPMLISEDTAFFRGNERVARETVRPGTDVRAYYRQDGTGMLKLISLEILEPAEVERMRAKFETGQ